MAAVFAATTMMLAGAASTAIADSHLSEGCTALNSPFNDGGYQAATQIAAEFGVGEVLTVSAGDPVFEGVPSTITLSINSVVVDTADFPGEVSYTVPADGSYTIRWAVDSANATWQVDCDLVDSDGDGVNDDVDNCPDVANADQADFNDDGVGDACSDSDNDGVDDDEDQCQGFDDLVDVDGDGIPDGCDPLIDVDGDGVAFLDDVCPGTVLGDADRPEDLKKNRYYAAADGSFVDDTGADLGLDVTDTGGCSASQIIEAAGLGQGHVKFGITQSALNDWIATL